MTDRPSPLPASVSALLDAERARPGVDPETRARVRAQLHASLLSGDGGPGGSAPGPKTVRPAASLATAIRRLHPLFTALVGFAVGVATTVVVSSRQSSMPPHSAPVPNDTRPATLASSVAPKPELAERADAPDAVEAPAPHPAPAAEAVTSATDTAAPVPSASTLTAERALLDVAHAALGNGQASDALTALDQHARRFPHGVYREEREALRVQCLRALGRASDADRLAAAFKARYPKSLFLARVEAPNESP